jgi:cytochrome c556
MENSSMKRYVRSWLGVLTALGLTYSAMADDPAPKEGPGWTGITDPMGVIAARQALMLEIELLMEPIDTYTVDDSLDPDELKRAARTISVMLMAVPHLFPPTTNLYEPDNNLTPTLALPRIWEDFSTFSAMATATSAAATTLSKASDPGDLRNAALALRASCDACHDLHLRPYEPSTVTEEDRDFDFDSIFQQSK